MEGCARTDQTCSFIPRFHYCRAWNNSRGMTCDTSSESWIHCMSNFLKVLPKVNCDGHLLKKLTLCHNNHRNISCWFLSPTYNLDLKIITIFKSALVDTPFTSPKQGLSSVTGQIRKNVCHVTYKWYLIQLRSLGIELISVDIQYYIQWRDTNIYLDIDSRYSVYVCRITDI